ncbi:hypothetical protein DsansV1_C18g0151531 [Dioscorea sansibarensis]
MDLRPKIEESSNNRCSRSTNPEQQSRNLNKRVKFLPESQTPRSAPWLPSTLPNARY